MKSILPIILVIIALVGAIAYSLFRGTLPVKPINNIGIPANQLEANTNSTVTPTQKSSFAALNSVAVTPTVTPTILPTITEKTATPSTAKTVAAAQTVKTQTTTTTTVCTPVYGSADTCTEHVVVDTGAEDAVFFNFAGLAYIGGLISFIKAKSLKK